MRINMPVSQQNFDFPGDELLVSSTNTKGEITHCNPAFVRVSGYSYEELIEATLPDFTPIYERLRDQEAIPAGSVLDTDAVFQRGSGEGWATDGDV